MELNYCSHETGKIISFEIICTTTTTIGSGVCYYAKNKKSGKYAWLFDNAIEYEESHQIIEASRVSNDINNDIHLDRNSYVWGGEVRDRRSNSMCARPYFPRRF